MKRFEYAAQQLNGQLVGFERLTGGSSAEVHALDLAERRVVFRKHRSIDFMGNSRSVTTKEFRVMSELHARGFPVAEPLLLDGDEGWLVTEYIDGTSALGPDERSAALDQMADFLVALHQLNVHGLGIDALDDLEDPVDALAAYLPASLPGEQLRVALESGAVGRKANESVLIHGDFWPGNMLWREEELAAVIDWEDAQCGDPLADLAGARVELLCEFGDEAMQQFTNRYLRRRNELDTTSLPLWEAYVSAAALKTMHLWGLSPEDEDHRRGLTTAFFTSATTELLAN